MGDLANGHSKRSSPGFLTKTIVPSPVIRWIVHARIRQSDLNDVVFVGDDFIHVKQVKRGGQLDHVISKSDFNAHIKAAKVFSIDPDPPEDDLLDMTDEHGDLYSAKKSHPPQLLALTLSTDELLFLYLEEASPGQLRFVHQAAPIASMDRILFQPGGHLAIDPLSRAIAVAANEREVVLYSAKDIGDIKQGLCLRERTWHPIKAQRLVSVDGMIQHMDFLIPDAKDRDHVVLLLIVVEKRKTKAICIDWHGNSDFDQAQLQPSQAIEIVKTVSSLLIPLISAAFLLITGEQIKLYRNLLSGPPSSTSFKPSPVETPYPGDSPLQPVWVGWCKPRRTRSIRQELDTIYLMREDGLVFMLAVASNGTMVMSNAGDAKCHAGMAFASLGDDRDPDILAFIGDMSNGSVVSIGHWSTPIRITELSRHDTMAMQPIATLSNWASCTDLVVSSLPYSSGRSTRSRDSIFVTSGRQPYGTVTELRRGLEARLSAYIELEDLRGTVGAWVLPNITTGSVLILLTTPTATRLYDYDLETGVAELDDENARTFDLAQRTLAADMLQNTHLLQVTQNGVNAGSTVSPSFEDKICHRCEDATSCAAAAIEPSLNMVFVVRDTKDQHSLAAFVHHAESGTNNTGELPEGLHQVGEPTLLETEVLCMTTAVIGELAYVLVADVNAMIQLFIYDAKEPNLEQTTEKSHRFHIPGTGDSVCDHIALLQPNTLMGGLHSEKLLALCGMRGGSIIAIEITTGNQPTFGTSFTWVLGLSTVRLARNSNEPSIVYAMTEQDLCALTWDGVSPQSLSIKSVWASDKARPYLAQGAIAAISKMPSSTYMTSAESSADLADSLVMISPEEVWIAPVDPNIATVPRQITVSGSPTRLIYAEQHRALVCASTCTSVRAFPSDMPHGKPEVRRQIWPAIDFIPADRNTSSFTFKMQPGERVYALLEWTMTKEDGKRYSFILVGGSYTKQSGRVKGRIAFLQPAIKNWEVVDVREGKSSTFEEPVHALALYDPMTYIACTGCEVLVFTFSVEETKWDTAGPSRLLASPGTSITVDKDLVHIATLQDALVTFRMRKDAVGKYTLTPEHQSLRVEQSLGHVIARNAASSEGHAPVSVNILSTKDRRIVGTKLNTMESSTPHVVFDAKLPASLTRIRVGRTCPRWQPTLSAGVSADSVVGVATDGSVVGITIIDYTLWRQIFWLQRLCEWSNKLSSHSYDRTGYSVSSEDFDGKDVSLPAGLTQDGEEELVLSVAKEFSGSEKHSHIDGDVLARVLSLGGVQGITDLLRETAARNDRVGHWVTSNLDRELEAVEALVEKLELLLNGWL
ncbi:hypothetical protein B0A48_11672 [Cryoendolithus antarcticus]|uniref:RSE1/DDB1/CPSF1 first beta-propeller domain-containing protein n=1 Tax=Cryoendolithus antarcticus TaxID=1507870 RepID=A0A1V8SSS5_9PEZI|nr:hypothetical protein B0A48_11672 [Cryoendolithus antarcticus]